MDPSATARRVVTDLSPTSTMRGLPFSSRWVRLRSVIGRRREVVSGSPAREPDGSLRLLAPSLARGSRFFFLDGALPEGPDRAGQNVPVALDAFDMDRTAGLGEFHGIGQQIEQNLHDGAAVGDDRQIVIGGIDGDLDFRILRAALHHVHGQADNF